MGAAELEWTDFVQVPPCSLGYERHLRKVKIQGRFNLFGAG